MPKLSHENGTFVCRTPLMLDCARLKLFFQVGMARHAGQPSSPTFLSWPGIECASILKHFQIHRKSQAQLTKNCLHDGAFARLLKELTLVIQHKVWTWVSIPAKSCDMASTVGFSEDPFIRLYFVASLST